MEQSREERQRVVSFDEAAAAFGVQLDRLPDLMDEVVILSAGSMGVLQGILETVSDSISYDPDQPITRERIRTIIGVPEDPSQLFEWRGEFLRETRINRRQYIRPWGTG